MTLPEVYRLFRYWCTSPPEHELLALLAASFTDWRPKPQENSQAEHRASLERRWKAGAMNIKQIFDAMGGALSLDGAHGPSMAGVGMPGLGPFPGST